MIFDFYKLAYPYFRYKNAWFIFIEDEDSNDILSVKISNDRKLLTIGTKTGYKIFSINPIKLLLEKDLCGGISVVIPLCQDKIVAFVGGGSTPAAPANELM